MQQDKPAASQAVEARVPLSQAKAVVQELDLGEKWTSLLSKDVPGEITRYVIEQARDGRSIDKIRESLGMRSGNDPRWKKIMAAVRAGKRVDATAVFVKWMERNERLGDRVEQMVNDILNEGRPLSKLTLEGLSMISRLQLDTIKMGKELGIFVDGSEKNQGGQGVTIVVQTNIPSPAKEVIIAHQKERESKAKQLLEQYRNPTQPDAPLPGEGNS